MKTSSDHKIIKSTCGLCAIGCGVRVHLKNGKPVKVEGDPDHPLNRGSLCAKGKASLEFLYHQDRLKHPLKRKGKRGSGKWECISWDEALESIARQFKRAKETYGAPSVAFIHGAAKGLQDSYLARFANVFGSPNVAWQGHVCFVPRVVASKLTYGFYAIPDYDFPPKCIILWGKNIAETLPHAHERLLKAREQGANLIVIDPRKTELAENADIWLQPRPGTDLLLALGMINTIISEGLYDRDFVDKWTTGFDRLRAHCEATPLKKVETLTWVSAEKIRNTARIYAQSRPAAIQWGNVIDHGVNSFQTARAICILRGITGNLSIPGGEAKPSRFPLRGRRSPELEAWDQMPEAVFENRVGNANHRPLHTIRYVQPQDIVRAILEETPYPIRVLFNQGGNPLTSYSNAQRVYSALKKLDFFVVAEYFMTPTAAMADIVLPSATYLEFDSIITPPYSYPVMSVQQKCTRLKDCRSDYEILSNLAKRLGFGEYFWETEQACLDFILKPSGISFKELSQIGAIRGTLRYRDYETEGFDTPSRMVELYSEQLKSWGYEPLPVYRESPETPFSNPELAKEYPLIFTTWKSAPYRHSGGRQIPSLRNLHPKPVVIIHPDTAKHLGINEGDTVFIETPRGQIQQEAHLSDTFNPNVVGIDYAWWFPEKGLAHAFDWQSANVNILTDDAPPFNPELGSTNLRGLCCKVYKEKVGE